MFRFFLSFRFFALLLLLSLLLFLLLLSSLLLGYLFGGYNIKQGKHILKFYTQNS